MLGPPHAPSLCAASEVPRLSQSARALMPDPNFSRDFLHICFVSPLSLRPEAVFYVSLDTPLSTSTLNDRWNHRISKWEVTPWGSPA